MAARSRGGSYATPPWAMLDKTLADELAAIDAWATRKLRADSARSCVSAALHLAPHIRPGRDGEPPAARMTAKELAEECNTSTSTTARALRRLVDNGFLSATPAPLGATTYTFTCHLPEKERPKVVAPEAAPKETAKGGQEETQERKPWINADGGFCPLLMPEFNRLSEEDQAAYHADRTKWYRERERLRQQRA